MKYKKKELQRPYNKYVGSYFELQKLTIFFIVYLQTAIKETNEVHSHEINPPTTSPTSSVDKKILTLSIEQNDSVKDTVEYECKKCSVHLAEKHVIILLQIKVGE